MTKLIVSDYVAPIVGYRFWVWDKEIGPQLRSMQGGQPWIPRQRLQAYCVQADRETWSYIISHHHEAPDEHCSCGIYAVKSLNSPLDLRKAHIYGEVYLWGKIIEHRYGYRAQFAYPKSFVLQKGILGCLSHLVDYGVEIRDADSKVLWTPATTSSSGISSASPGAQGRP
jgi:hypothetical protein